MDIPEFAKPLFAAFAGACVTAIKFCPGAGVSERVVNVVCGTVFSAYCTPLFAKYLGFKAVGLVCSLAFLSGMFGMAIAVSVMRFLREVDVKQLIQDYIKK